MRTNGRKTVKRLHRQYNYNIVIITYQTHILSPYFAFLHKVTEDLYLAKSLCSTNVTPCLVLYSSDRPNRIEVLTMLSNTVLGEHYSPRALFVVTMHKRQTYFMRLRQIISIAVSFRSKYFVLTIERNGSLLCRVIMRKALRILQIYERQQFAL